MAPASPFATLSEEITLLNSLTGLMKQEQGFLVSADTDGLNSLMQQKSLWIEHMARLAAQRHQALAGAGFAAADSGMQAWLDSTANSGAAASWQQLLDLARQAMIDAMRVPAGAAETGFYGPSGQATVATATRKLVVG